jgi:hypothetical protein
MDHPVPDNPESNSQRPDWLVGADEGVSSERERVGTPLAPVRLVRPQREPGADSRALELESTPDAGNAAPRESLTLSSRNAPPEPKKKAWTAAASSVPKLSLVQNGTAAIAKPINSDPVAPTEAADADSFLDDPASLEPPVRANRGTGPARPRAALREPWWVIALDAVRADRRVQLGLLVVAALSTGWVLLQPKEDAHQSLRSIRTHPERFDGSTVTVTGRVGEVFPVGGGYAFFLHQGRDTLVVFTRARRPETRAKVVVKGSISTGFLDGRPRQALFEAL